MSRVYVLYRENIDQVQVIGVFDSRECARAHAVDLEPGLGFSILTAEDRIRAPGTAGSGWESWTIEGFEPNEPRIRADPTSDTP